MLIGPSSVLNNRTAEIFRPGGDCIKQKRFLNINKCRYPVTLQWDASLFQSVDFTGDFINREHDIIAHIFRQRFILIFTHKCRFILELQIHSVLQSRDLIIIEPSLPLNNCSFIHFFPVFCIKICCRLEIAISPQRFCPDISILFPELHVFWHRIKHLCFFSVPVWMSLPVENRICHISRADNSARHNA